MEYNDKLIALDAYLNGATIPGNCYRYLISVIDFTDSETFARLTEECVDTNDPKHCPYS